MCSSGQLTPLNKALFENDNSYRLWRSFDPLIPLGDNEEFLKELWRWTQNFLEEAITDNEKPKIQWLAFSLWDTAHRGQKFKVIKLGLREKPGNTLGFYDWSELEERNSRFDCFNNFVTQLNSLNEALRDGHTDQRSAPSDIHFWDFLHFGKRFNWPIAIHDRGWRGNDPNAFNILVDGAAVDLTNPMIPDYWRVSPQTRPQTGKLWWDWRSISKNFSL